MPSSPPQPSKKLAHFNSWSYFGLGVVAVVLVLYLAVDWTWLYSAKVAPRYRVLYWALLAFLLLVAATHFTAAFLLRRRVLVSVAGSDPATLRGFDSEPEVQLLGSTFKLRVAGQLVGTNGLAYLLRLQNRWYLAVASAAEAVKAHKAGERPASEA
ncbi:hypothetical protein [Rubrivivax rivuli]|uniref:Uncharacterized protein n=1 Tax=Rubrivivax rivuli TaxID=1862385 RepID=A0A437R7X4_9BURK|nr:hypothetical protein [Rubrivivax rivuli]RVU42842.1 hypothetical protein EOE66_21570 [Rubrivivax rivuli]